MRIPEWWKVQGGTAAQYQIFVALLRTGRREGVDFQRAVLGGSDLASVDFTVFSPRVGLEVRGQHDSAQRAREKLMQAMLESQGLRVEWIDEDDAIQRPDGALREALGTGV